MINVKKGKLVIHDMQNQNYTSVQSYFSVIIYRAVTSLGLLLVHQNVLNCLNALPQMWLQVKTDLE